MRGRPPVIIVTMILCVLNIVTWAGGLPRSLYVPLNGINAWLSNVQTLLNPAIFSSIVRLLVMPGLACAVLYAGARRPPWERPAFIAYGALVGGLMWVGDLYPHVHALPSSPAQQAGYVAGQWFAGLLPAFYLYRLWLGRRAKQYFHRMPSPSPPVAETADATS